MTQPLSVCLGEICLVVTPHLPMTFQSPCAFHVLQSPVFSLLTTSCSLKSLRPPSSPDAALSALLSPSITLHSPWRGVTVGIEGRMQCGSSERGTGVGRVSIVFGNVGRNREAGQWILARGEDWVGVSKWSRVSRDEKRMEDRNLWRGKGYIKEDREEGMERQMKGEVANWC